MNGNGAGPSAAAGSVEEANRLMESDPAKAEAMLKDILEKQQGA